MDTIDKSRAARLLLGALDDDEQAVDAVLNEAYSAAGGLQGLLAALAAGVIELLIGTVGEANARKSLSMTLLDASLDQGGTDG